jgi:uncharacterized protein YgbK (DUF1537 family)
LSADRIPSTTSPPSTYFADIDHPEADESRVNLMLAGLARANRQARRWFVVLDDDPTGSQTVRDVPILMGDWSAEDLDSASRHPSGMTVVLTNSRSLEPDDASALTATAITACAAVATRRNLSMAVISRSDSTLRGHFSAEIETALKTLRDNHFAARGIVFAPCFLEAGRYTAGDVQWVTGPDGRLTSAADSEFARDPMFGYSEHILTEWVSRQRPASKITSTSLSELRSPDATRVVTSRLRASSPTDVHVVNAARSVDLITFVTAAYDAAASSQNFLYRTGPTALRILAGQPTAPPLTTLDQPLAGGCMHGLIVVGSHTALTNQQLDTLNATLACHTVELNVTEILASGAQQESEIHKCVRAVCEALSHSVTVLQTTRTTVHPDTANPLRTTRTIAAAVNSVVRQVCTSLTPQFLLAKGGITSHDLAAVALQATRADVLGQLLPGHVSIWRLHNGRSPRLPYVVFPGNVGDDAALATAVSVLTQKGSQ